MKPARILAVDDDPNELRARIRTQLKRVRHHQHALALRSRELDRLESSVAGIQEAALACQVLLSELGTYLDIVDHINDRELRDTILTRAQQGVRRLTQSLSRIVAWTNRQRSPP